MSGTVLGRTVAYLARTVVAPGRSFHALAADPRHLAIGVGAVLLQGGLYTLTVAGLARVGAEVAVEPWLRIPPERYYFFQTFFTLPVFFAAIVMGAGLAQLLARAMRGQGTFEQVFAVFGVAATLPWYITWVVETVGVILILGGWITHADWLEAISRDPFWQVFALVYQLVPLAWFVVLMPLAVGAAHGLRPLAAAVAGWVPALAMGMMLFAVIR